MALSNFLTIPWFFKVLPNLAIALSVFMEITKYKKGGLKLAIPFFLCHYFIGE